MIVSNRFPVDRWLDSGEGDKRISLDLEPDKKPGQLPGKTLRQIVHCYQCISIDKLNTDFLFSEIKTMKSSRQMDYVNGTVLSRKFYSMDVFFVFLLLLY